MVDDSFKTLNEKDISSESIMFLATSKDIKDTYIAMNM